MAARPKLERTGSRFGVAMLAALAGLSACSQPAGEDLFGPVYGDPFLGGGGSAGADDDSGSGGAAGLGGAGGSAGDDYADCSAGDHECVGASLRVCAPEQHKYVEVQQCASPALCDAPAGTCLDLVCQADQYRCNGDALEKCNGSRTAFTLVDSCGAGMCDAAARRCDDCTAGATSCASETAVQVCDAGGKGWSTSPCPADAPRCVGQGSCVQCVQDSDCPSTGNDCIVPVCYQSACAGIPAGAGSVAATQIPNDCKIIACDGKGGTVTVGDTSDLPDDGNPCTADLCQGMNPTHQPMPPGSPCGIGGKCNGAGVCQ